MSHSDILPNLLAIDASTELCSVALQSPSGLSHKECSTPKSHAKVLLPMVDELLSEASLKLGDIAGVIVSRGPGSFTGIRICLSVAHGLAYAANLPITGYSSLDALAKRFAVQQKIHNGLLISALDARMGEIYWAVNEVVDSALVPSGEPRLNSPEDFSEAVQQLTQSATTTLYGIGHGWSVDGAIPPKEMTIYEHCLPHALGVLGLSQQGVIGDFRSTVSEGVVEPLYLRNDVAWEKRKRIRQSFPFS